MNTQRFSNKGRSHWSDSSGWRAVIGEDFTFQNVKLLTQAVASQVKAKGEEMTRRGVVVGYDSRFLSSEFAKAVSCVLAANGICVFLTEKETPTPVVAHEIWRRGAGAGISITASHNPPEYSGMKFFQSSFEEDLISITREIRKRANSLMPEEVKEISYTEGVKNGLIQVIDPVPFYLDHIKSLINTSLIRDARLKVVVDPMYGTSKGILPGIFKEVGCRILSLHTKSDPLFGGQVPDPKYETLREMARVVVNSSAHLGVATDGDADRFGIVDRDGRYIEPNQTFALLLHHLLKTRRCNEGVVVKNIATSHFIDAICKRRGIKVIETPVGFKYICEVMKREKVLIGGEESGGITIHGHIPEKDGILACLLMAEVVATERKGLGEILQDLYDKIGSFLYKRINIPIDEEGKKRLLDNLDSNPPTDFSGLEVREIVSASGGKKFMLKDGSWIFFRPSNTEEIVRCYIDTDTEEKLQKLAQAGERFIREA
ncbi:MAG: phosphoglucomutase/phosphomannomutase family protein [bacterium]|nr:phosphoglucomutase/phosphomannomutase family protein [bacterium]